MKTQDLDELLLHLAKSMEASHRAQMDLLEVVRKLVQERERPATEAAQNVRESKDEAPKVGGALKLRDTVQAAEFLGMSKRTLDKWRVTGGGPRYYKGGRILYAEKDLLEWLEARNVAHTTEADSLKRR